VRPQAVVPNRTGHGLAASATQVASDFDICTNVACDSIVIQTYGDQRLVRHLWVVLQKLNGRKATIASAAMTWPYRHVNRGGQLPEKLNNQPWRMKGMVYMS
jgi:hypothetical protein